MVAVRRLNGSVFFILILLLSTRRSLAYTPKATAREKVREGTDLSAAEDVRNVAKDNEDTFEAISTPEEAKLGKIGGRKLMNKRVFGKEYVLHLNNQKENNVAAEVTKVSGANTVGNSSYGHKGKGKMNSVSKLRAKISTTSQPVEAKNGDLSAFSADYRKRLRKSNNQLGTPERHMLHEQSITSLTNPKTRSSRTAYLNTIDEYQHWKPVTETTKYTENIMSLMNKDYPGGGYKPRHTPPINNDEAFDHQNVVIP